MSVNTGRAFLLLEHLAREGLLQNCCLNTFYIQTLRESFLLFAVTVFEGLFILFIVF